MLGRLTRGLYAGLCCPDPCYKPCWLAVANAAFFQNPARTYSHTRFRWDAGRHGTTPDRGEVFWARRGGKGPGNVETRVNYDELSIYTETAVGNFSIFVQTLYRSLDPLNNPHAAGFSDIEVGTKSLFLDTELLQASFQFTTIIPSADFRKGLGAGHVSLEPAFLIAMKILPETWLQTMLAERIPLGADQAFGAASIIYRFSLNHVIARPIPATQLIGTLEFLGQTFQDGLFTHPVTGVPTRASGTTYFSIGPGIRLSVCDKADLGFGMAFSVTEHNYARQLYRTEFRVRF
jgi:hypothetical protein